MFHAPVSFWGLRPDKREFSAEVFDSETFESLLFCTRKLGFVLETVLLGLDGGKVKKEPHAGARNRTKLAVEKARGDVQVSGSSSDEGSSSDDDLDFVGRILD